MSPRPPASDTAAARDAGASPPPIGAFSTGCSTPRRSHSRVCSFMSTFPLADAIDLIEVGPQRPYARCEATQLLEMTATQLAKPAGAERGQAEAHDAMVDRVGVAHDE